ncbi:unnamed protein product [Blepharisma stoltei]|uniref:Cyclic nucleotide-binding domain-containing protein n=1 Tax=Blepharisma stoltei TaxID=1481888 RepID=A0AAU9IFW6_9CILI|nr:unnamed protein product [Blepharisma stoltei]
MNETKSTASQSSKKSWASSSIARSVLKRAITRTFLAQNLTKIPQKNSYFPDTHKTKEWRLSFGVLKPDSLWKLGWDILGVFQILYLAFTLPFALSYGNVSNFSLIIKFIEVFCYLDILINFNTGYYTGSILIKDHKLICKRYLKSWFFWDLVSSIPLEDMLPYMELSAVEEDPSNPFEFDSLYLIKTLWLLRLLRFSKVQRVLYNMMNQFPSPTLMVLIRVLSFLGLAFYAVHWMSCIVFSAHRLSYQTLPEAWSNFNIPRFDKYIYYFFYVFETMATVGYLSIATDPREKILVLLVMYTSGLIYGYLIEGVKEAIAKSGERSAYYRNIALQIKYYMNSHKLPSALKAKVFRYIENLERIADENILDETEVLQSFSLTIKEEILLRTRGLYLINSAPFRNYSQYFLRYLVHFLDVEVFGPHDRIVKEDQLERSMYWIFNGSVEIYDQKTLTTFRELFKGKYFGEIGFFLGQKRCASVSSTGYTELFELKHSKFNNLIKVRHNEEEVTKLLVRQCEQDLSALGVRCYFCSEMGHTARDCKRYVYIVDYNSIIRKSDYRKYKISKTVKKNEKNDSNKSFKKKVAGIEQFRRYGIKNLPGRPENFGSFKNRATLMQKARSYQTDSSRLTFDSRLALIEEAKLLGDDFDKSPDVMPASYQFSKNFVNVHSMKTEKIHPSSSWEDSFSYPLEVPNFEKHGLLL